VVSYVRLKDVADRAGVSANTVSRALKGKRDIGKETQKRIKQIAAELGYVPHAAAVSLRSQTSRTIGVIVTFMDNPFYARILKGINDALSKHGYNAITWGNDEDTEKEKHILNSFASHRVAGILIVPARDRVSNLDYDTLKTRHITITRKGGLNTQSYFTFDSYASGQLVADHFLKVGRKRPAYLGLDLPISTDYDRFQGYRETFGRAGIELRDGEARFCAPSSKAAYLAFESWMKEKPDFDCLFVGNDQLAFGALRACRDLGVRVPEDVAVIGHDNVEMAQFSSPSLSTIRVPKYTLGFESAESLIKMIKSRDPELRFQKVYRPRLVARESSG
jgi:LacI family transcriptional regulator